MYLDWMQEQHYCEIYLCN